MAKKGLNQKQLAESLEVSPSLVTQWLTGGRTPQIAELVAMSKLFGVSIDTIVTGKTAKTRTEELEVEKENAYDFYKYINREYDLKERPELIREHFDYLTKNPDKCREIPIKYGEWNVGKTFDRLVTAWDGSYVDSVQFELLSRGQDKLQYTFFANIRYAHSVNNNRIVNVGTSKNNLGKLEISIKFDDQIPSYCGELNFDFNFSFFNTYTSVYKNSKPAKLLFFQKVLSLASQVFSENGLGNTFLIADNKDSKMAQRECMTRKIHYFVIPRTANNNMFWNHPLDEVSLDD